MDKFKSSLKELQETLKKEKESSDAVDDGLRRVFKNVRESSDPKEAAYEIFVNSAHVKLNTLRWALQKVEIARGKQHAAIGAIKCEIQATINSLKFYDRNNNPVLPQEISESSSLSLAFQNWMDRAAISSDELSPYIKKIMNALPHVVDCDLSDRSALSDFRPSSLSCQEFYAEISKRLGIEIDPGHTLLVDLAQQLKHKFEGD